MNPPYNHLSLHYSPRKNTLQGLKFLQFCGNIQAEKGQQIVDNKKAACYTLIKYSLCGGVVGAFMRFKSTDMAVSAVWLE
jgi:hypothetical protein